MLSFLNKVKIKKYTQEEIDAQFKALQILEKFLIDRYSKFSDREERTQKNRCRLSLSEKSFIESVPAEYHTLYDFTYSIEQIAEIAINDYEQYKESSYVSKDCYNRARAYLKRLHYSYRPKSRNISILESLDQQRSILLGYEDHEQYLVKAYLTRIQGMSKKLFHMRENMKC